MISAAMDKVALMKTTGRTREMSTEVLRILAMGVVVASLSAVAPRPVNAATQSQNATAGAAQQSNQSSDIAITRDIRRALVKDKSLSVEAHNVTIITKGGKVTLKGRVQSAAEKQTVESAAGNVAGVGNVDDQLTTSASQ
jgi:hyperosmotically inducible periplasmic protein